MKLFSKIPVLISLIVLSSFTALPGGEGFEVYLNNKLVIQQFGSDIQQVKSLSLTKSSMNDKLTLKYYHCGRVGKNRIVTIKDAQDKTIKTFHYPDTTPVSAMEIPLKEILNVKGITSLKIFYSSTELPQGRNVLAINTGSSSVVVTP